MKNKYKVVWRRNPPTFIHCHTETVKELFEYIYKTFNYCDKVLYVKRISK